MAKNHTATNATAFAANDNNDVLDKVDVFAIMIAILTAIAMVTLIWLSVLFARYRKRNKVVVMLQGSMALANEQKAKAEAFNKELKASLKRAQKEVDKAAGNADKLLKQYKIKHAELTFQNEIGHGQVQRARSQML